MRVKTKAAAVLSVAMTLAACSMRQPSPYMAPSFDSQAAIRSAQMAAAEDAPEPEILPATYYRAARLHESSRRFDLAIHQYQNAIRADAEFVPAHNRLGILLGYLGRHQEAEGLLQKAVALAPDSPLYHNNLGFEYILQEDWYRAETEFRRALLMSPGFDRARINLGVALGGQARFDEALAEFRQVVPEADAQYNLGLAYATHRDLDSARKTFERVLALKPGFEAAIRQLEILAPPGASGDDVALSPPADDAIFVTFSADREAARVEVEQAEIAAEAAEPEPSPATPEPAPATLEPSVETAAPSQGTVAEVRPGDLDGDGDVDLSDFAMLQACITDSGEALLPGCRAGDFDSDGDVDLTDFRHFQEALTPPQEGP